MIGKIEFKDLAGLIAILIAVAGLVWNAAQQAAKNDDQGTRIVKIEAIQDRDHDRIGALESGQQILRDRQLVQPR